MDQRSHLFCRGGQTRRVMRFGRRVRDPGRWRDANARADHAVCRDRYLACLAAIEHFVLGSARVRMTGALTQGALHVQLYSVIQGISTTGISVPAVRSPPRRIPNLSRHHAVGASYDSVGLASARYADGTPTSGADSSSRISRYFPREPYNASLVRASFAEDPESTTA